MGYNHLVSKLLSEVVTSILENQQNVYSDSLSIFVNLLMLGRVLVSDCNKNVTD